MNTKKIHELSSTGRHQECLQACQHVIQSEPENPLPWKYAGKSLLALRQFRKAQQYLSKAHQLNNKDPEILKDIGNTFIALENDKEATKFYEAALSIDKDYAPVINNLGLIAKCKGNFAAAVELITKARDLDQSYAPYHINLGIIHKELGDLDQALSSTLKSLELKPNNPDALTNLGAIYKDLGNLDQALSSTLKSLELNPDNATAHMNLGGIHKDLGNIDKALSSTLKSLELKPNNPGAINKISELIGQINISEFNSYDVTKAYELALNQTNISHRKLTRVFLQVFLPIIQKASAQAPIISESNQALKALAGDWRFLKSMTLIIPPNAEVERFLTRLRKELLNLAIQGGTIPPPLKPLIESLAAQCFLNEYVYSTSKEEVAAVSKLVEAAANSQEYINQYLALIGCYIAIHTIGISSEIINNYPTHDDSSKELISTQFTEPLLEKEIRNSLPKTSKITDTTSQLVQKMYEENPYPRFKFSDYTESELASPACIFIKLETTRKT